MYIAFTLHAASIALISRWLLLELAAPAAAVAPKPWLVSLSTATFILYPNFYEILFWPTCMAYTVGGLFLAAALYARTIAGRAVLFALAFLTYETFVLPALILALLPSLAGATSSADPETRRRALAKTCVTWVAAAAIMFLTRGIAASFVGPFAHGMNFSPSHIAIQIHQSLKQLFQVRFGSFGTNIFATTAMLAGVIAACVVLHRRWRWNWTPTILLGSFVSTGAYWVLNYSAIRAIYGSQLVFAAAMVWLAVQASRSGVRHSAVALALSAIGFGFVAQTVKITQVKDYNSHILEDKERALRSKIVACGEACLIEYEPLDLGLRQDWVLPPPYWEYYLDRLAARYGHDPCRDSNALVRWRKEHPAARS